MTRRVEELTDEALAKELKGVSYVHEGRLGELLREASVRIRVWVKEGDGEEVEAGQQDLHNAVNLADAALSLAEAHAVSSDQALKAILAGMDPDARRRHVTTLLESASKALQQMEGEVS